MSIVSDAQELNIKGAYKIRATKPGNRPVNPVVQRINKQGQPLRPGADRGPMRKEPVAAAPAPKVEAPPEEPIVISNATLTFAKPAQETSGPAADTGRGGRKKKGLTVIDRGRDRGPQQQGIVRRDFRSRQRNNAPKEVVRPTHVTVETPITVKDLCSAFAVKSDKIVGALFKEGIMKRINDYLDKEEVEIVGVELEVEVTFGTSSDAAEEDLMLGELAEVTDDTPDENTEGAVARPPIITVLGHVDHGKTSLLDRIRETDVAGGESGGITQHIGATVVQLPDAGDGRVRSVTLVDTPGHEAFTEMRARGSKVTDIVVLVVAADDGVMPTTKEAIAHARAADVPIIVALNKVDKPDANVNKVKGQLAEVGLAPTGDWGGETEVVETSAHPKSARGIDDLLETVLLQAEIMELRATPTKPARGTVIEARKDPDKGIIVSVLVQDGTLKIGDHGFAGVGHGKIRYMIDDKGDSIFEAGPSTPIQILGFDEAPTPGDTFYVAKDQTKIRQLTEIIRGKEHTRKLIKKTQRIHSSKDIISSIDETKTAQVAVVVKADTQGSVEVLEASLQKLSREEVRVNVLYAAPGGITESDVVLAEAGVREDTPAIVLGFHVIADDKALRRADESGIPVETFRIIYELEDFVRKAMQGQLKPEKVEVELGRAEIRQVIHLSKVGNIAGSYVTKGSIPRNSRVRVYRQGVEISPDNGYELGSLKRHKDDVKEVREGFECGFTIAGFNDIQEGDIIESFKIEERERKLS